ncbi:MAG: SCO family protein [Burkholderiaceae bacterium]
MVIKTVFGCLAQRAQRRLWPLAAALALLGAAGWAQADEAPVSTVPRLDEAAALAAGQAVIGTTPPDFTFLDRQGKPVRLSQYRGKPLLVSFIYTGCFEICPTTTRNLHEAVRGLDKLLSPNQFNVISIGFNQPADSPVALRSFARQYGIDYPNWEFLSPHAKIVEPLTRHFGFSYLATPAGLDHILGVTVLDAEGKIATQVWGDKLTAQQLGEPLRQLLGRAPLTQRETLAGLLERVRILCTVYDPETGSYRFKYALVMELVGGAVFFLWMIGYGVAEWRRSRRARRQDRTPVVRPEGVLH